MADSVLSDELKFFDEHREMLVREHAGRFALIKGADLVGIYDTAESAYEGGARLYGNEAFLIQEIVSEDPIVELLTCGLGMVNA